MVNIKHACLPCLVKNVLTTDRSVLSPDKIAALEQNISWRNRESVIC
jgi:hypothetical protein